MTKLNNDHFQNDLNDLEALNDFDDTLTQPKPLRHDLYCKAHDAVTATRTMQHIEAQLRGCGKTKINHAGSIFARGDCAPDRPGTVRNPGVRRQPPGKVHFARFGVKK